MSDGAGKRKQGPGGNGPATKKSKGGSGGKWQTPHQKARKTEQVELGRTLEVNDAGIWVTYARGMKGKAIAEFKNLCNEYGESLFGVKPPNEDGDKDEDDEDAGDIEASIEKELASMAQPKPKTKQTFTPIGTGLDCVFFMKTVKPVDPLELVTKASQDARDCPDPMQRKTKYINRLTPIFDTDKATDKGIERVARSVMEPHFELKSESAEDASAEPAAPEQGGEGSTAYTYAIRYNIRNHTSFKSSEVIKKIADLVSPKHKVNLTSPDKVVLVEIFQTFCGVSVVDGQESEELKRYNLNELYKVALEDRKQKGKPEGEGVAEST